jgi:basic amino acid/polyamine antiporter, APA family
MGTPAGTSGGPYRPSPHGKGPALVRGLSLVGAVALVVGNMVGTSVYTLPASLALAVGPMGIASWLLTAAGYLFVAVVYASLGARYPRTSGPYVYARRAFGDLVGFQTAWAYWLSTVIGNAAIVTGVVAYASGLVPGLGSHASLQFALAQVLVWGLCALNVGGVRQSGRVQVALMVLHLVPLVAVCVVALFFFDATNLHPFAPHGYGSVAAGVALVVWAYSGVESATVPAEEVAAAGPTIRRATMVGYALATAVFVLIAFAVSGGLSTIDAGGTPRPLALLAGRTVGPWAAVVLSAGAAVAGIGTLNGWILMAGRIPVAAAEDQLCFPELARIHPTFRTPHVSLIAGTVVTSVTLSLYFSKSLLGVFDFVVLLSVLTTLLPHLVVAAAELRLARREPDLYTEADRRRAHVAAPIAFAFLLYAVYGVGARVTVLGFALVLAGLPLYFWFARRRRLQSAAAQM